MSTHDDVLTRATAAARAVCDEAPPPRRATRDAVLARALDRRRGARRAAVLTPLLAATLVCSTAWAATTGRLAPVATWWHAKFAAHAPSAPPVRRSVRVVPVAAPVALVAVATVPPSAPSAVEPTTAPYVVAAAHAPRAATVAHADASEALYAAAHQAHFAGSDPAAALAAWDAYLHASPHGRFAPEARYNRAIDLIHLGRDDEARAALRPFVDGRADAYRRTEAQRLLDALGAP